jgi:hypothetical protein
MPLACLILLSFKPHPPITIFNNSTEANPPSHHQHSIFSNASKNSSMEARHLAPLYKQRKGDSHMTTTPENATPSINEETLAQRWKERCTSGEFSQTVLGLGTIRIMGKAGDAPVQFPRIPSLETLEMLEPDEQWAVKTAQAIVTQACSQHRPVLATPIPQPGLTPTPKPVTVFDPSVELLLVTSLIRGG